MGSPANGTDAPTSLSPLQSTEPDSGPRQDTHEFNLAEYDESPHKPRRDGGLPLRGSSRGVNGDRLAERPRQSTKDGLHPLQGGEQLETATAASSLSPPSPAHLAIICCTFSLLLS